MYFNNRKMSAEELEEFVYKLLDCLIDDVYNTIEKEGVAIFFPDDTYKQRKLIKKMIEHYVEIEQYEKCAVLTKLQKLIN